jgi:hypothetical protein
VVASVEALGDLRNTVVAAAPVLPLRPGL